MWEGLRLRPREVLRLQCWELGYPSTPEMLNRFTDLTATDTRLTPFNCDLLQNYAT